MKEKTHILNKQKQKVVVLAEASQQHTQKGVVFVAHGLAGYKEQLHIQAIADVFKTQGYIVIRWDATNSFGESDGKFEDATVTSFYDDLKDVVAWSKQQPWYREPFLLSGHSLGALSCMLYAEEHPQEVKALIPVSPVISGELSVQAYGEQAIQKWKETGTYDYGTTPEGKPRVLKWAHMEDRLQYNVLPDAAALTMPVLMIVGEQDDRTPVEHQKLLIEAIPGEQKEFHVIPDSGHVFYEKKELDALKHIVRNWEERVFPTEIKKEVRKKRPPLK